MVAEAGLGFRCPKGHYQHYDTTKPGSPSYILGQHLKAALDEERPVRPRRRGRPAHQAGAGGGGKGYAPRGGQSGGGWAQTQSQEQVRRGAQQQRPQRPTH